MSLTANPYWTNAQHLTLEGTATISDDLRLGDLIDVALDGWKFTVRVIELSVVDDFGVSRVQWRAESVG